MAKRSILDWHPLLEEEGFELTSEVDDGYNCIAWAAEDTARWWWPESDDAYWPSGVSDETSVAAFVEAFETLGYERCEGDWLENGYLKIAIYADANDEPTHASRQLPDGSWTHKLGEWEDLTSTLRGVVCDAYGDPIVYMRRVVR